MFNNDDYSSNPVGREQSDQPQLSIPEPSKMIGVSRS